MSEFSLLILPLDTVFYNFLLKALSWLVISSSSPLPQYLTLCTVHIFRTLAESEVQMKRFFLAQYAYSHMNMSVWFSFGG